MSTYYQYSITTSGKQKAEALIAEARANLQDREKARELQGQQPLQAKHLFVIDAIDQTVRDTANGDGDVGPLDINYVVNALETPAEEPENG